MNADEYRDIIARLGLSQVKAGAFVGVDARTSRRWATGDEIPESAARLLRLALYLQETFNVTPDEMLAEIEAMA